MNPSILNSTTTNLFVKSILQLPRRCGFALAALAALALSPTTRAVSPPPDGDYGNGNTAEGNKALFSLTTGISNTAIGD